MRLIAALMFAASPGAVSIAQSRPEINACGPMALCLMLQLEGRPGGPQAVVSHLPPRSSGGYSMWELREAAKAMGLTLTGVRVGRGDPAPDRPILALLDKKPDGHFVVVRPVGRTGKLVQVIDPVGQLEVLDASALYASPEWTGMALIPSRPNWPLRAGIAVGIGSLVTFARYLLLKVRWPGTGSWPPGGPSRGG